MAPIITTATRIRAPDHTNARLTKSTTIRGQYGTYEFDAVLDEHSSQDQAFQETALPLVNKFLQGSDCCILVYGTGQSGKTYTLEGPSETLLGAGSGEDGIIARSAVAVLKNLAVVPKHRYCLTMTYCGLSAGMTASMVDLLSSDASTTSLKDLSAADALDRLQQHPLELPSDVAEVLRIGRANRAQAGKQAMHTMLTIQLFGRAATGEDLLTCLTFVELMAPEPKDARGHPAPTDPNLFRSLSLAYASLTSVISTLKQGSTSRGMDAQSHVPWRDSPLTRWLKDSLLRSSYIMFVAAVTPGPEAASDTLATLGYVSRMRSGNRGPGIVVTATWEDQESEASGIDCSTMTSHASSRGTHNTYEIKPSPSSVRRQLGSLMLSPTSVKRTASPPRNLFRSSSPPRVPPSLMGPGLTSTAPAPRAGGSTQAAVAAPAAPSWTSSPPRSSVAARGASAGASARTSPPRSSPSRIPSPTALSASRGAPADNDVAAYFEILKSLKKAGPDPHAESLLEGMLRQMGDLRSALAQERGDSRNMQMELTGLRSMISTCDVSNQASEQSLLELQREVDDTKRHLEAVCRERDDLAHQMQRVKELSLSHSNKELEKNMLQAQYERRLANLEEDLRAKQNVVNTMASQLTDQKRATESVKLERDRLQCQVQELTEKLQGQVRQLSEETARLKAKALESAHKAEKEEVARRAAEAQTSQMTLASESSKAMEAALQQQVQQLQQQMAEATAMVEAARVERNKLQELKWKGDEHVQRLATELEAALTSRQQVELEAKVAVSKAHAEVQTANSSTEAVRAELGSARAQIESLQKQLRQLQLTLEDQKRIESTAAKDIKDVEQMLRDFDRDLEVHATSLWRHMRSERSDALLIHPDGQALTVVGRWQPMMRSLMSAIRHQMGEHGHLAEMNDKLQHRLGGMEAQVSKFQELSATLAAHQTLKAQQTADLEECYLRISALQETNAENERLRSHLAEVEQRLHLVSTELRAKEDLMQRLAAEKEALQANAATASNLLKELRSREQLADQLWAEIRALRATVSTTSSPQSAGARSPTGFMQADSYNVNDVIMDWSSSGSCEKTLRSAVDVRMQVAHVVSELTSLRMLANEAQQLRARMTDQEGELQDAKNRMASHHNSYSALEDAHRQEVEAKIELQQQLSDLERHLQTCQEELISVRQSSSELHEELKIATAARDTWKEQVRQQEGQLSMLYSSAESSKAEASRAKAELQRVNAELGSANHKNQMMESQLQDTKKQLEVLTTRLAATEKSLAETSSRASDLNGRLALAETDARLKVQELVARLSAAEDQHILLKATHSKAMEQLERQLKHANSEVNHLKSELEASNAERLENVSKAEAAMRQMTDIRAKLMDAEHVHSQLHAVMAERDGLMDQIRQLKNGQLQGNQEVLNLQRDLEAAQGELQRVQAERMSLIAQVEAARLDSVVNNALARNKSSLMKPLSMSSPAPRASLTYSPPAGPTPQSVVNERSPSKLAQLLAATPLSLHTAGASGGSGTASRSPRMGYGMASPSPASVANTTFTSNRC